MSHEKLWGEVSPRICTSAYIAVNKLPPQAAIGIGRSRSQMRNRDHFGNSKKEIAGNGSAECSAITIVQRRQIPNRVFGHYAIYVRKFIGHGLLNSSHRVLI